MPNYYYTAKSFDGKTHTGMFFASNIQGLVQGLKSKNLILIDYKTESNKKKSPLSFLSFIFTVSAKEKVILTRNLWIMFSSGLSLTKSLNILAAQTKNATLKKGLLDISRSINKGISFSDALERHSNIFSDFFVSMVKVGEESGKLEEVFESLSTHLEKEYELKAKIKGALIYPCIVLAVIFIIGIIIVTFVLPKISDFFENMDIDIPFYTRLVLDFGAYAQTYWYLFPLLPLILVAIYMTARKTEAWKAFLDSVFLKIPIISPLIKKNNTAIFMSSLSSLLSSGVPLLRSLEITSNLVKNSHFRKSFLEAAEKVKNGQKMSESLKVHGHLFPVGAIEVMEVGEETGKTPEVLKKLAGFYEQEIINATQNLAVIIESVLIIALGLVVGFFAISVINPMYSSFQNIR